MKRIKMLPITICAFLVLVLMDPVMGMRWGKDKNTGKTQGENMDTDYCETMSVLQTIDLYYHTLQESKRFEKLRIDNAEHAAEYAKTKIELYGRNLEREEEDELKDYSSHYLLFSQSAVVENPETFEKDFEEVAYAKAFVTYKAFLLTIYFRISELYYRTAYAERSDDEEHDYAKICHRLFLYMHWFTFSYIEQKAYDFGKTARPRSFIGNVLVIFSSRPVCTVENVTRTMSALNLDFIMNLDYLRNTNKEPRKYKSPASNIEEKTPSIYIRDFESYQLPQGSTKSDDIVLWRKIPRHEQGEFKFLTLFPKDLPPKESIGSQVPETERAEEAYKALRKMVMQNFKDDILIFEKFFSTTLEETHQRIEKLSIQTLMPNYKLSMKIWEKLPDLQEIMNLKPTAQRKIHGGFGIEMIRSNAVEIIRTILEITAKHYMEQLPPEKRVTAIENGLTVFDLLSTHKDKPGCNLSPQFNIIGYVVKWNPSKTISYYSTHPESERTIDC